jgi:hypothetical protein
MAESDMQSVMTETGAGDRWWRNNFIRLHRIDGPAVELVSGRKEWWIDGRLHRTDGPAIEYAYGAKSWYLNDGRYTFDEWLDKNQELTDEEKVMYKLEYG